MQQKMFAVKKSNGLIYNFFPSTAGGICYKIYSLHNNQKVDPFEISITDEKVFEFSVSIDAEDNIHILCLTESGDLKYFINRENSWESKVVSHFDLRSNIIKSLFIHIVDKKVYIMYAASNSMNTNLWTIYFKGWNGVKWSSMNVGMTVSDKESLPYYAGIDNKNNIHLVYKSSNSKGSQIFYRKFHEQFSLWSSPERAVNSPGFIAYYYVFCDTNGSVHLVWSASAGTNFKLLYKKMSTKVMNNKLHDRIVTLDISNHAYAQPVILEIDKIIWVLWKKSGTFYGSEIEKSGLSSSGSMQIQISESSPAVLVEFISNYEIEKQNFNGHLLYGIIGEFIDIVIPYSYSCDLLHDGTSNEITDIDDKEIPTENISVEDNTDGLDLHKDVEEILESKNIKDLSSSEILERFNELKADNDRVIELLQQVSDQLEKQKTVKILEEIKTQNESLIQAFLTMLKNEPQDKELLKKKKGAFKGIIDLFKND